MKASPYFLLKMVKNDRSFSTVFNRFSRIYSDITSILFSSEKNEVSDPGIIFSVNYNEIP